MTIKTGRFAIIEQLVADGITHMVGNPGTVEQGFLDALSDYPSVKYILGLQETVAVGIADGYARATHKPTIVQLHSGVGVGNGIGMMYQAKRGHAPLVVIAGESGLRYDAMEAQMWADLVAMTEPVTKWSTRVVDPGSLLRTGNVIGGRLPVGTPPGRCRPPCRCVHPEGSHQAVRGNCANRSWLLLWSAPRRREKAC